MKLPLPLSLSLDKTYVQLPNCWLPEGRFFPTPSKRPRPPPIPETLRRLGRMMSYVTTRASCHESTSWRSGSQDLPFLPNTRKNEFLRLAGLNDNDVL